MTETYATAASRRLMAKALSQKGVGEVPLGSNLGREIRKYKACTWLNPDQPWPWCVAFVQWVWEQTFGHRFPYATASVEQMGWYVNKHGLVIPRAGVRIGCAVGIGGGEHITFYAGSAGAGTFYGFGGNQSHQVRQSVYSLADIDYVIPPEKIGRLLEWDRPKPERPRAKFEVVRGLDGQERVVKTVGGRNAALQVAEDLLKKGAWGVSIRKKV